MSQPNNHDSFRLAFLTAIELPDRGHVGGLLVTNHLGRPLEFQCTAPVKANRTQEILYGPTLVPYLLCDLIGRTLLEKVGVKPQLVLVDDPRLLDLREQVNVPVMVCTDAGDSRPSSGAQLRLFGAPQLTVEAGSEAHDAERPQHSAPGARHPVLSTYSVSDPEDPARRCATTTPHADHPADNAPDPPIPAKPIAAAARSPVGTLLLGRRRIALHPAFAADAVVLDEARRRLPGDADLGEPFERVREALRETMGAAA